MVPQAGIGMKNNAVFLADFRRFLPLFRLLKCHFMYVSTLFYPLSWLIRGYKFYGFTIELTIDESTNEEEFSDAFVNLWLLSTPNQIQHPISPTTIITNRL